MERLGLHFNVIVCISASSNVTGKRHAWTHRFHGTLI
jgi:hypothetical protein